MDMTLRNGTCFAVFSTPSTIVLPCLNGVSGVITVCGNILVLLAILRTPSLRVSSNVLIASLSAADLSIGLVMNPLYATIVTLNIADCEHSVNTAEHFMWIHTVITTTFSLAAVSVERYIAIVHPLHYKQTVTTKRSILTVAFIWCFSLAFASTRATIRTMVALDTLWIVHSVFGIAVPLCVISFCYFYIFRAIRRQHKQMHQEAARMREQKFHMALHAKLAWTMALVIVLFVLFWTPNIIIAVLLLAVKDSYLHNRIYRIWFWCATLAFFSSAINPFIYSIRMNEFRAAIKKICFPFHR